MLIIVGLGNPGEKLKNTRHNIGFMAVDFFGEKNNFPDFELSKKYKSLFSKKGDVMLIKPQTFMNESGRAVKKIMSKNKSVDLVVIHDDIDLPSGKLKIVRNRGSAGHKGVESIIKSVGNKELIRFRLGIQPKKGKPKNAEKFVIQNFTAEEKNIMELVIEKTAKALEFLTENELEKAMNEFNR